MNSWPLRPTGAILISLEPGDDVLDALTAALAAHGVVDGVVVSGIGTLDRCRLHCVTSTGYPPTEQYPEWDDHALELVQLAGAIVDGEPHLHGTVADTSGAWAGHIEPGCRVLYLGEIVVLTFSPSSAKRSPGAHGILRLRDAERDNPHRATPPADSSPVHSKERQ